MSNLRIGFGFDVHRFTDEKKELVLGGVSIPCGFGVDAVSDGDIILHAISDAILGATGLGDIGDYFPPEDSSFQGIDSRAIVKEVRDKTKGCSIVNIDITLVAEKPRLVSYKRSIVISLKDIFHTDNINLKIKSKENLPILGGIDAIACFVVIMLETRYA
ncbi:MAG: 2-C-methyl-D-erythritol 2,4-cyclodiphosphate synthase [Candidatus Omnitrophica bacterium]|nr:2-C-methyl-D-erythritol 2,4-cyclodiphosphate synthase [Candidatus Omnitrophota bacterium]